MSLKQSSGTACYNNNHDDNRNRLQLYINLKLASSGQPTCDHGCNHEFMEIAHDLLKSYREKSRLLTNYLCPSDHRIQNFLDRYFDDFELPVPVKLPSNTIILDRPGVARELSLPPSKNEYKSDIVNSYCIKQGILHNPKFDRRTTAGSFHIAEGGLPIPGDKKSVPKKVFAQLLSRALNPPNTTLQLPFTAEQKKPAEIFVSLLLRPIVCPEVPGFISEKTMEIRFFAPGSLVSNLDFVESIFGNAGNPYLADNDAGLDIEHWTGHTGCVILAPHLIEYSKKELGLPHFDDATEQQRSEGMCWQHEADKYNDGSAFKITARDEHGVIVTILADNYFGYCKKEVKTQISYSTNLYGLTEEEHAGGALAFTCYNHGEDFGVDKRTRNVEYQFKDVYAEHQNRMILQPEGHALDINHPDLIYVPEYLRMNLNKLEVYWTSNQQEQCIKLQPGKVYMHPSGYKVELQKHPGSKNWRLVGTEAEGTLCHKPCTVSGGGKSEISKSINDAVIYSPLFVADLEKDLDQAEEIIKYDFSNHILPEFETLDVDSEPSRPPISPTRSLGSLIKLFTPSSTYRPEYNQWLEQIPNHIRTLLFVIKRFYRPDWGDNWRSHFSVDMVNGSPGNELKCDDQHVFASYLRVGFDDKGAWRTYKLRQDYVAAEKVQMEDDITASIVVPAKVLSHYSKKTQCSSVKIVKNCETRLFQRPDEAIHRGFDKQTEIDMAEPNNFIANFEPLDSAQVDAIVGDVINFSKYTQPMQDLLLHAAEERGGYVVSSAHPRIVDGKPSKNPRYLQLRPDLSNPFKTYVAQMGALLNRRAVKDSRPCFTVDSVLTGRRNNPPEPGIKPLAVYNPIHYQELPELFMDFICSLTGKSPSTTGAGSEGALTKGPFNALRATADLNNTLVSYIITGYNGYSSAAGWIGPHRRVDHDISLLIPEIWARLPIKFRSAEYLIENEHLEKLDDFEHNGKIILASRLGYRITSHFVHNFFGRIFDSPTTVFDEQLLKPETQDMACFIDGINNIVEAQQRVAQQYLDDKSVEDACPPLKALIHIMAEGSYQGMDAHHPDFRAQFTREALLNSNWYKKRLQTKQDRDIQLWQKHIIHLTHFLQKESHDDETKRLNIADRLHDAKNTLKVVSAPEYLEFMVGTIGADPMQPY